MNFMKPVIGGSVPASAEREELPFQNIDLADASAFIKRYFSSLRSLMVHSITVQGSTSELRQFKNAWNRKFLFKTIFPSSPVQPIEGAAVTAFLANGDLLCLLLSYIEAHDLLPLRLVCRRWNSIVSRVPAAFRSQSPVVDFEALARSLPRLHSVSYSGFPLSPNPFEIDQITTLQHLRHIDGQSIKPIFASMVTKLTQLESLAELNIKTPYVNLSALRQLTRLECSIERELMERKGGGFMFTSATATQEAVFDFNSLLSVPSLVSLRFSAFGPLKPLQFPNVEALVDLKHLTHLDLNRLAALLLEGAEPLLARLTNLRSLTSVPFTNIRLPRLEKLCIFFDSGFVIEEPAATFRSADFPALLDLDLADLSPNLAELTRLTRLASRSVPELYTVPWLSSVRSLSLRALPADRTLSSPVPPLPALQDLELNIEVIITAEMLRAAPNLTALRMQITPPADRRFVLGIATQLRLLSMSDRFPGARFNGDILPLDPSRYLWLRNLTSLHTLHLNYSPVVLDECDEWVGALTNLRQLHCLSSSLRPSHLTKLVQLRSLRTLYVDSFTDRFELRQRAKELVPNLYIREMN